MVIFSYFNLFPGYILKINFLKLIHTGKMYFQSNIFPCKYGTVSRNIIHMETLNKNYPNAMCNVYARPVCGAVILLQLIHQKQ